MKLSEHRTKAESKQAAEKARQKYLAVIVHQSPSSGKWVVSVGRPRKDK